MVVEEVAVVLLVEAEADSVVEAVVEVVGAVGAEAIVADVEDVVAVVDVVELAGECVEEPKYL